MKTDELIKTLSEDATKPRPMWRSAGMMGLVGGAAALILFFLTLGVRPDLAQAAATGLFQLKMAVFGAIAVVTAADFYRLMRPGARQVPYGVIAAAAILTAAAAYQLSVVPPAEWQAQMFSGDWRACLVAVPFLALGPLAAAFVAMRAGAPASPGIAGLAAGGVAAAVGAAIYATHCPADTPIFYAVWYTLGAAGILGVGTAAGQLTLRW